VGKKERKKKIKKSGVFLKRKKNPEKNCRETLTPVRIKSGGKILAPGQVFLFSIPENLN